MEGPGASVFRRCALASGLVTPADMDAAEQALAAESRAGGEEPPPLSVERLSRKLIESGVINAWQADQLRHGRAKFTLGPYLMIDSIGQGGMGQVFKAEHTLMGRVVAVKVLPRQRSTPDAITSFHREIRAQAQLDHENLVRALDAGHDGNVYYLVTEYVPGTDLRRLVRKRGRLSMAAAASIVSQAALGLEHAHAKGMIHRDIKPGNLLVTPEGEVKVSDLGLVSYFDERGPADEHAGKIVGTADYLSPEQIREPQAVTPASDIYSLGCTLYYAVTGKVPFPGGTTRDKAQAHCTLQPFDPRRFNAELSADFVEVLAAMMAKSPSQRVPNSAEVVRCLAPWTVEGRAAVAEAVNAADSGETAVSSQLVAAVPGVPAFLARPSLIPPPLASDPPFVLRPAPDPDRGESPSQISQVTPVVLAAEEDTVPSFLSEREPPPHAPPFRPARWLDELPTWLRIVVIATIGGTLFLVGAMAGRVFRDQWPTAQPAASDGPR